jgi:hypothetical protein
MPEDLLVLDTADTSDTSRLAINDHLTTGPGFRFLNACSYPLRTSSPKRQSVRTLVSGRSAMSSHHPRDLTDFNKLCHTSASDTSLSVRNLITHLSPCPHCSILHFPHNPAHLHRIMHTSYALLAIGFPPSRKQHKTSPLQWQP